MRFPVASALEIILNPFGALLLFLVNIFRKIIVLITLKKCKLTALCLPECGWLLDLISTLTIFSTEL